MDGVVSNYVAQKVYGVVINKGKVDKGDTKLFRDSIRKNRLGFGN